MWDLSRVGIEPTSPATADRFLTTKPPWKPGLCYSFEGCTLLTTTRESLCASMKTHHSQTNKQTDKKEGHSLRKNNINWKKSARSKMADELTSNKPWASVQAHCNTPAKLNDTPPRLHDNSKANSKGEKVRSGPIPGNLHPFSHRAGIFLPLISLWNYPLL